MGVWKNCWKVRNVTFTVQLENNICNREGESFPKLDCTLQQNVDQHTQQTPSL